MIFKTPDPYQNLLRSIFVTCIIEEIVYRNFTFFKTILQLCFKYAFQKIIVKIWCSKYQKLCKTLIRGIFQDMYMCTQNCHLNSNSTHCVEGGGWARAITLLWQEYKQNRLLQNALDYYLTHPLTPHPRISEPSYGPVLDANHAGSIGIFDRVSLAKMRVCLSISILHARTFDITG